MPDRRAGMRRADLRHPQLRTRVRDGELLVGTFVKSRDPATTEALAVCGYDFIVADLEHSAMSVADVEGIVRACDCYDVPVVARLPATGLGQCGRLLDIGVSGIQVSDVSSAVVARAARAAAHYPPVGDRSLSLSTRAARFGVVPAEAHVPASLAQTVLIGQIESAEGVATLDEIIESDVFDALFIGPTDLSLAFGHAGQPDHPDVAEILDLAVDTITASGSALGIFCANVEQALAWADRGCTLLAIGTDLSTLASAGRAALGQVRARP